MDRRVPQLPKKKRLALGAGTPCGEILLLPSYATFYVCGWFRERAMEISCLAEHLNGKSTH
jgi:hypothetical protein